MPDQPAPLLLPRPPRPVLRALAWFTAIQIVVAALVLLRGRVAVRRREAERPDTYPARAFEPVLLEASDDEVRLYMRGADLISDLITAIDAAEREVLLETFIWADDVAGRAVRDAVARAAGRGVKVHVLWDWLLSDRSIGEEFFPPEVEVHAFKRVENGIGLLRPSNLLRDHRKLVVVDERVAFLGGYNIGASYLAWRDTHLRLEGVAAREAANAFGDFWNQHTPVFATHLANVADRPWDPHVLVHRNDPTMAVFPIRGMYLEAIDRAQERVWLTNAYFVPDRAFRGALTDAARRGVDVRVLLPARSNHPLTDTLAHGMFEELLESGARVFLYRDFMLHAKTALVDDMWCTVGTANLDRWSMFGNHELNLEVRSPKLNAQLADMFELDLTNADEVQLAGWRRRPLHWRASERVLRSLAPLM
ncbi:MAG: phospholipase D/Transphosphatidylase [Thermoleophilia bacterium]|nr:phospholipase D/Transphosphatidylase [Thermoleophilia bacterium]